MWNISIGKEIARILNLMADKPNSRPHPTDKETDLFDGGQLTVVTGRTTYKFSDGSTASYVTNLKRQLTIWLATGEVVHIEIPTTSPLDEEKTFGTTGPLQ